ncbi:eCIS core domain-containing protein [Nostoc sp.]|uniref:eCIS core domain-containing protein n=1 Tax=Nostoc sp. TaxID=1180 RepID=UPI002FF807BB
MHNKRLSKTLSSINTNSQTAEQNPKLAYRPFGSQIQKASAAPVTQSRKEDVAFTEQKMEAFGLELQAKYGKITPEGQERLTVLQAKMDGLLNSRLEHATRFSYNIANIPLTRPDTPTPIQAKLTIGEPGDKYEQEADKIADKVVERIYQPQSKKLQRESLPEDEEELQMKPLGGIQRESLPDEEDELQVKPMVQRRVSNGGMAAATQNLEASINQARGGGQPMEKNYREKMEQGFGGADFSRVKIHTDSQADQLNRSIQAKAFTTGQDVFFRQGEYKPGSRGGQELIAHELTHVMQQNGRAVEQVQPQTAKGKVSEEHKENKTERQLGSTLQTKLLAHNTMPAANVVQRRNGASIVNWHTQNIRTDDGFITHNVGWESSTGVINDLDDFLTREEVTWTQGCPWAIDPDYQTPGQHHGMGTNRGNVGQNMDTHQASQPYFNIENPRLKLGESMEFVMTQVYQYSSDGGITWNDIPESNYILRRTLKRKIWPSKKYVYKLTKQGLQDRAVNHTTKVEVNG